MKSKINWKEFRQEAMGIVIFVMVLAAVLPGNANAGAISLKPDKDNNEGCFVEEWTYSLFLGKAYHLEGTSNCDYGEIVIKTYKNKKLLEVTDTYISNGIWKTMIGNGLPSSIKYKINR